MILRGGIPPIPRSPRRLIDFRKRRETADLFVWATDPDAEIRIDKSGWFSKENDYSQSAADALEIAVAPDRSDFGKWNDVRDLYFGNYDALVKYPSASHREEFLLERDDVETLSTETRELWEYFGYPINGAGSGGAGDRSTGATFNAYNG